MLYLMLYLSICGGVSSQSEHHGGRKSIAIVGYSEKGGPL